MGTEYSNQTCDPQDDPPAQARVLLQALELAEGNIRTNGGLNYAGKADVPWDLAPTTQWVKEPE